MNNLQLCRGVLLDQRPVRIEEITWQPRVGHLQEQVVWTRYTNAAPPPALYHYWYTRHKDTLTCAADTVSYTRHKDTLTYAAGTVSYTGHKDTLTCAAGTVS